MRSRPASRSCDAREVSEFVDRAQDVADAQRGLLSELRQPDLSRAALDEHRAQDLFEFLDLHRQRRLRNRTGGRRASEVAMRRQRIEIVQLPQRDLNHQNILSLQSLKSILLMMCIGVEHASSAPKNPADGERTWMT